MKKCSTLPILRVTILAPMLLAAPHALALSELEKQLEAAMPSVDNLENMKQRIASNPENLDHYFDYAMLAKRLKNAKKPPGHWKICCVKTTNFSA